MWRLLYLLQLSATDEIVLPRIVSPACERGRSDEIVVCAGRDKVPRYGPSEPNEPDLLLPKAEFGLFGASRLSIAGEQRSVGGFSVPAATISIRVPF